MRGLNVILTFNFDYNLKERCFSPGRVVESCGDVTSRDFPLNTQFNK